MDKEHNQLTNEELQKQEKINGLDLAMQIQPILPVYFHGEFKANSKGLLMAMPNGQVFQLTVTEVNANK